MSKFACVKLGDLAKFSNGVNFDKSAYTQIEGVKLIGVSDFGDRLRPDYDELGSIKSEFLRKNDFLQKGDVVFVRSNGNKQLVGRSMIVDQLQCPTTFSGFCIRARFIDHTSVNPLFFAYYFRTREFRQSLSNSANGTNIQNLNQQILNNAEVPFPELAVQNKIVFCLRQYDDLININNHQISLLEEAAQRLYREWFVNRNFPNSDQAVINADGLPEGWKEVSILDNEVFLLAKSKVKPFDGQKRYYATADVDGTLLSSHFEWIEYDNRPSRAAIVPLDNSVWFARMSNSFKVLNCFGASSWLADEAVISSGFCGFTSKPEYYGFVYNTILSKDFDEAKNRYATGATQVSLTNDGLEKIMIVLPTTDLIQQYSAMVEPMMLKVEQLHVQNAKLAEARDLLLPRLMSGEVELENIKL